MAELLPPFQKGQLVIFIDDNLPHAITKVLPGKIQLDDRIWVREFQKLLPTMRPPIESNGKKPRQTDLRDRWIKSSLPVRFGLGNWRRYADGYWPAQPRTAIEAEVMQICEIAQDEGTNVTDGLVTSVYKLAIRKCFEGDSIWDSKQSVLVMKNGTLELDTLSLREHRQDDFATRALHYDYDPDAECPVFEYALNSTIEEAKDFFQDFAGYCLTTETKYEIAVWLQGVPGSGKSTVLHGLKTMMGDLCGKLGLADIEMSRFALNSLPGKRLMISTEQPGGYVRAAHVLNAIISGETVKVEEKFHPSFSINPFAKLAWAMNKLPQINSGADNGIFRRVKVIKFPPLEKEMIDYTIKERIEQEGAGILNWALEGLRRVQKRGGFDIPKCVQDASDSFAKNNDKATLFFEECCLRDPEYKTQSSMLYTSYKAWCFDNGYKPQSSHKMAGEWERLGCTRRRSGGRSFWLGVGLLESGL